MLYSLDEFFRLIDEDSGMVVSPSIARTFPPDSAGQGTLFDEPAFAPAPAPAEAVGRQSADSGLLPGDLDFARLPGAARRLFELSAEAFDAFVHALMSELPVQAETLRFGRKVLAGDRRAADRVRTDRGDPDVQAVLEAAGKVQHEIHRLLGFLRFSPGREGFYIARCAPDHFVLPSLASHFVRRFGETPWAIIDEKRRLSLVRRQGREPELFSGVFLQTDPADPSGPADPAGHTDPWEDLWRQYHGSVNIENRKNPGLQRQFMPLRYWKYLPEMN